jgi:plasmid maintenance system antidote protein VapI
MTIESTLKRHIRKAVSIYAVSRDSGVAYKSLNEFTRGERDLSLASIQRLADFFGLELLPKKGK